MEKQAKEKDEKLHHMKSDLGRQEDEVHKLREELNLYKGRCSNLERDI